ncbi:hypothetical protein BD626DRAFT_229009 [Schizophyllum amplum]|uniref:Uncharacterized protein n=1 Tax=Schizophyllum amplum TaxID=97359 RepID=A0A550BWJ9_9AGAR|nr:hypothetical protein BD626DRAFT_229009 [Auriculariopsis ampla]
MCLIKGEKSSFYSLLILTRSLLLVLRISPGRGLVSISGEYRALHLFNIMLMTLRRPICSPRVGVFIVRRLTMRARWTVTRSILYTLCSRSLDRI